MNPNISLPYPYISQGDDCISIVSGSENVQASNITCGPGHGIRLIVNFVKLAFVLYHSWPRSISKYNMPSWLVRDHVVKFTNSAWIFHCDLSIGSLGAGNSEAIVSEVTVNGAKLMGTTNGVRIKTWQVINLLLN
jgi:galacturan 1,4-alpha-galacturonidase